MIDKKIKFNGIYDKRTIAFLNQKKIFDFSLDFRPRSLNFIQAHLAEKIVKDNDHSKFYLHFENRCLNMKAMVFDSKVKKLLYSNL